MACPKSQKSNPVALDTLISQLALTGFMEACAFLLQQIDFNSHLHLRKSNPESSHSLNWRPLPPAFMVFLMSSTDRATVATSHLLSLPAAASTFPVPPLPRPLWGPPLLTVGNPTCAPHPGATGHPVDGGALTRHVRKGDRCER